MSAMSRRTMAAAVAIAVAIGIAAWWWRGQSRQQAQLGATAAVQPGPELLSRVRDGRRAIFIGLDGADWSLLDRYVADGTMPTLGRLVREGTSGVATTLHPPL